MLSITYLCMKIPNACSKLATECTPLQKGSYNQLKYGLYLLLNQNNMKCY